MDFDWLLEDWQAIILTANAHLKAFLSKAKHTPACCGFSRDEIRQISFFRAAGVRFA